MTIGLRYAGSVLTNAWQDVGGVTGGWSPAAGGVSTFLAVFLEQHRLYISPSRYSAVRKVVFSLSFQHLQTGGTLDTTFSLRVGPTADSATDRTNVETMSMPISTRPVTVGAGSVWTTILSSADGAFYDGNASQNHIAPRQMASPRVDAGAQTLVIEFERGVDDAFFVDWDAAALLGDDEYMAYNLAVERDDGGVFTGALADADRVPTPTSGSVVVVQAPAEQNDSCTYFQATGGLYPDESYLSSSFQIQKTVPFVYRESDWDGLDSIHLVHRQTARSGGITEGWFRVQIVRIFNDSTTTQSIYTEDFSPGITSSTVICRTADVKSLLVDGGIYVISGSSLSGATAQDLPWGWWEVVQKNFSRKLTRHHAGFGNPSLAVNMVGGVPPSIGDYRYSVDQTLFDPDWYENLPASFFIGSRFVGGLDHRLPNDSDQLTVVNTDLGADIPNSATNLIGDEVSSTPDADDGQRVRDHVIGRVDPLLLGSRSVMKHRYNRQDWTSSNPDENAGANSFEYTFTVPNEEFPELGPLFEVGAFNPEGCASTAAGLGDNPGMLFMTNGASVPKKFNPTSGLVENAGMPVPYREEEPGITTASVALSPDGGLTPGIYQYRYTLRNCCTGKESDPNPVDIEADVSGATPAGEVTLNFNGVVIPADPQICEICIYRTVEGGDFPVMAKVGCFDPDVATTFVDTASDSILDFVNEGLLVLNAPMPCVTTVVEFRNRLFGLGDIPNLDPPGTVSMTNGSDILEADSDTEFDRCIVGKFIQIEGDCTAYEVLECLAPIEATPLAGMRLKLVRDYEGTTDEGLNYIICGHPNRLFISEPLEGECWPGVNFLDVDPGDGDRLIGAVSNFNRLVIMKRRKTYVVAFREQPAVEIVVPTLISKDIGCIAPRSVAQVSSGSVWLSDRGLALYDGRGVGAVPESSVMNDLFVNPENPNYLRRDANGRALGAAGVFYPKREQYLLLLPTVKTDRGASMLMVWDTELRNVTLLEFCQEFLSIEVAKDSDGNERVYLGDTNGFVWIWDVGDTDGVGFPNATGTVRGTVTATGVDPGTGASFLEDSTASFVTGGVPGIADLSGLAGTSGLTGQSNMGMAGACIFWRGVDAALGTPWQSRFIYLSTATRIYVTPNWGGEGPSVGDEYMLGPIEFVAEFKPANYGTDDFTKRDWRQVIVHEQESVSTELRTELLRDFQNSDVDEDTVTDAAGVAGLGRTFDLGFGKGRQIRPVGRLVHEFMGVRLSNFAPDEPMTILNHLLMMGPRTSK